MFSKSVHRFSFFFWLGNEYSDCAFHLSLLLSEGSCVYDEPFA